MADQPQTTPCDAVADRWNALVPRERMDRMHAIWRQHRCDTAVCSYPESGNCVCAEQYRQERAHAE